MGNVKQNIKRKIIIDTKDARKNLEGILVGDIFITETNRGERETLIMDINTKRKEIEVVYFEGSVDIFRRRTICWGTYRLESKHYFWKVDGGDCPNFVYKECFKKLKEAKL